MDARTNDTPGEFTIAIDETVELPDGSKLRLDAHRHKDVTAGMGPSPLIVQGAFARPGKPLEKFEAHVELVRSQGELIVQGERFEVLAHVYGASMRLRHLGRP